MGASLGFFVSIRHFSSLSAAKVSVTRVVMALAFLYACTLKLSSSSSCMSRSAAILSRLHSLSGGRKAVQPHNISRALLGERMIAFAVPTLLGRTQWDRIMYPSLLRWHGYRID